MEFDSKNECARYFKVKPTSIHWRCVSKGFNSDIKGFYFRYKEKTNEQNRLNYTNV